MNDALKQQVRGVMTKAEALAQELLVVHTSGVSSTEKMLAITTAFGLAMVACGRAMQLDDERLRKLLENALSNVQVVQGDLEKLAGDA